MTHAADEDGRCQASGLQPGHCAGCLGDDGGAPERRAGRAEDMSQHPSAVRGRARNRESMRTADRAGRPWSPEDDRAVLAWSGPPGELARRLGRTLEAVHMRKVRLVHGKEYR